MSNHHHPQPERQRKRLEYDPEGRPVLISDTEGVSIRSDYTPEQSYDLSYMTQSQWLALHKALPSHSIVFDNATKTVKLVRKRSAAKAKQEPQQ